MTESMDSGTANTLSSLDENAPNSLSVMEATVFVDYLKITVSTILQGDKSATPSMLDLAFDDPTNSECIKKFLSDPNTTTIFVQKSVLKDEESENSGEGDEDKDSPIFYLSNEVIFTNQKMTSLSFMKRGTVIEADKPISSQLRIVQFNDGSPYETLHALVSRAIAPYFKSYVKESGRADRDGDKMAPSVEKTMVELEMGLLHLQQNIDIPEVTLTINPTVLAMISKCAEENRKPKVSDFGALVEDSKFLNQLQAGVNRWIKEIQKVTNLDRDPLNGTALQEISFWLNKERALHRIQEKRDSLEVGLTLEILKHGKRFHATVSFDSDTGLKTALATVNDYNTLMKDFPINDLLAATDLVRIRVAIEHIFIHLRKIRSTKYPLPKLLKLVEAISRDLLSKLLKVLGTRFLMHIPYDEFEKVMSQCFNVFTAYDDEFDKLYLILMEIVINKRKRDETFKVDWRIRPDHKRLQTRLEHMRKFRQQHEQLQAVIMRVLRPTTQQSQVREDQDQGPISLSPAPDTSVIEEVNSAYENIKVVDCLDISREGVEAWEAAVARYEERIDRVEARITAHLRDQLGTARNANEMFRIFSRFNALFDRPHIRGAIREYQTQLINKVKEDIEALHDKFKTQYPQSKAYFLSYQQDIPPIAGFILWAKIIDSQLSAYLRRVEDVLGKGWEDHLGQKLKADGDRFRLKLNTKDIFKDWARGVQQRNMGVSGRIFTIESTRSRTGRGNVLKFRVNFLPEIITLSKEVRHLKNLGFRVPLAIVDKACQANRLYPFAISLRESVRTYECTLDKIEDKTSIVPLIAGLHKDTQALIAEGIQMVWDSYKLDPYVQKYAEQILAFQEKVEDLLVVEEQLDLDVRSLETCAYSASTLADILSKIQRAVDDLSLRQYSNLHIWVTRLDQQIEKSLSSRLQAGIEAWTEALEGKKKDLSMDTDAPPQPTNKLGGDPQIKVQILEVRITNQTIYLYPNLCEARVQLMQQFFAWQAVVTSQIRLQSSRYQVGLDQPTSQTYQDLLANLPSGKAVLTAAFDAMEKKINEAEKYMSEWLIYQSLWDLQADNLYNQMGEDINTWMTYLNDIQKSRKTFDTTETRKDLGPFIIEYGKVQSKVALKYDSWHKEILNKFGGLLGNSMTEFHVQVAKSRNDMEKQSIEAASTSDAVSFITYVQSLKRSMRVWDKQVELYKKGQKILERQRFQFPTNWLDLDNVEGEWSAFNEIIKRKDKSIQTQVQSLQMKIIAENKAVETRTNDFLSEWEQGKPVAGNTQPDNALSQLQVFENKFTRIKEERDNVAKAKEALELKDPAGSILSNAEDRMIVVFEEMQDLKGVWSELSKIWVQIDEIREKPWLSVQPRKLRQQLDGLTSQLKELPARFRQYSSYEYVKKLLQSYVKVNMTVIELKSDALKDRHWKQLMRKLRVNWTFSDITLGQVWDVDLQANEAVVKDIIMTAQGEMALEEFLKQDNYILFSFCIFTIIWLILYLLNSIYFFILYLVQ